MVKEKKQDNLILPKKDDKGYYISYSQYTKWKRSKREYIRSYFFKEGYETNAYAEFGTKVGEALEENDFGDFTKKEQEFLSSVPRLDEFERQVNLYFDEGGGAWRVMGYVDSNTSGAVQTLTVSQEGEFGVLMRGTINHILDYKTADIESKKPYYDSDEYSQLEIYGMAIEQETGVFPEKCEVVLIGRSGNAFKGEKLKLTGEYEVVNKVFSEERLKAVREDLIKVAKEISDYYKIYLRLIE